MIATTTIFGAQTSPTLSFPLQMYDLLECGRDLTVAGASPLWLEVRFPPLLRGAEGSPHSTPVGFPPGRRKYSVTQS